MSYLGVPSVMSLLFMVAWQCIGCVVYISWFLYLCERSKRSSRKTLVWSLFLLVFCFWPVGVLQYEVVWQPKIEAAKAERQAAEAAAWRPAKLAAAPQIEASTARFRELCKEEHETIFRTATNVDGVFLMNPLKEYEETDLWQDDPVDNAVDILGWTRQFSYVDVIDAKDGKRYRMSRKPNRMSRRVPVTPDMPLPRYGVVWKDITRREDRERFRIAGGELKVIDLKSGETMAQRVRYIMAPWGRYWEGKTRVFKQRQEWGYALRNGRCPGLSSFYLGSSQDFARKALKPKAFEVPTKKVRVSR